MDNLTHSLLGALIGQTGLKRKTGLAMPALIIGANIPDVDGVCMLYGTGQLAMRRGITHGPPAMVILPLLLAGILYGWDRWQARRGKRPDGRLPVRLGWLYLLGLIGCLSHPALDWLNNYGVRLLEPFSSRWFYGDAIFIVDIWLWLGMGIALWLSARLEKRAHADWRRPAWGMLALALAYVGGNIAYSRFAASQAMLQEPYPARAYVTPVPAAFWQRDVLGQTADGRWYRRRFSLGGLNGPVNWLAPQNQCAVPGPGRLPVKNADLEALLFWSRMPFAQAVDGGVMVSDARFAGTGRGGPFSVFLPGMPCIKLPKSG